MYKLMANKTDLYIGEKKIKDIQDTLVIFDDGSQESYTEKQLEYLITKEPKDWSQFRELKIQKIAIAVLEVFIEHDIEKWLVDPVLERLIWSYNEAFAVATWKAFWTYEDWMNPVDMTANIKISDIQRLRNE